MIPSFTLNAYWPGHLNRDCHRELAQAKKLGFKAVALTPSFAYDPKHEAILEPSHTVLPGEVTACLEEAWNQGFDIVYQPHLDALSLLKMEESTSWRADFDVKPDAKYEATLFEDFFAWLEMKKTSLADLRGRHVDIMLSAELERSLARHPSEWSEFVSRIEHRLSGSGLRERVRMGLNVNWSRVHDARDCNAYAKLLASVDFIGVSLYGDFSKVEEGSALFARRMSEFREELGNGAYGQRCHFDASKLPVSIAEFGVGGELRHTERSVRAPASESSHFSANRLELFQGLLSWSRQSGDTSRGEPLYLNFWTTGVYDVFGFTESQSADPEIQKLLR